MKKLFLLVAILAFSFASAQDIHIGAKTGLNVSTFYGDDTDDTVAKVGVHIGGMVEIPIADKFAVQPELLFSTMGAKNENDKNIKLNLSYLSVPVMAKYYIIEDALSVEAGPQMGFLLSAKLKNDSRSVDYKDELKGFDFGLGFGAGYKLEDLGLYFGARYNLGLTGVYENDNIEANNAAFQLSVGYFFM